jgi:hypothetical protein
LFPTFRAYLAFIWAFSGQGLPGGGAILSSNLPRSEPPKASPLAFRIYIVTKIEGTMSREGTETVIGSTMSFYADHRA